MSHMNKALLLWRKNLANLLDEAFENDKDDLAVRLRISSLKCDFASAVDELDRHTAAESELRTALQLVQAALTLLAFLADKDGSLQNYLSFDVKQMTVRADLSIQNAFSYDPSIPEHEPMPAVVSGDPTHAAIARCEAKIAQIRNSISFLSEAVAHLRPRIGDLRIQLQRVRRALIDRRIRIMQSAVEIVRCGVLNQHNVGPSARVFAWTRLQPEQVLPVEDEEEATLDQYRPAPAPTRWVASIRVSSEGLPVYIA
ncbi:hypothetical protein DFJ73DRAFT_281501 [Zopfochytrium polystomum]|nr:hypothetical protein DFJ73DRAFT_281501 [Zopfochytrium polystomum]